SQVAEPGASPPGPADGDGTTPGSARPPAESEATSHAEPQPGDAGALGSRAPAEVETEAASGALAAGQVAGGVDPVLVAAAVAAVAPSLPLEHRQSLATVFRALAAALEG